MSRLPTGCCFASRDRSRPTIDKNRQQKRGDQQDKETPIQGIDIQSSEMEANHGRALLTRI
jgi:hypothetical protein